MTQLALHTKKLLLVDDEPELLSLLETVFKAEGFTNIVTALDVASALDTFQKVQPDLAILDVSLPDGDGFTLCSYLRTLSKGTPVPVIFLTAKDETADRLTGLKKRRGRLPHQALFPTRARPSRICSIAQMLSRNFNEACACSLRH